MRSTSAHSAWMFLLLVGPPLTFCGCSKPKASGPDVIVILVDTLRQDALGCYGHPDHPTPAMDALAADGTRFDQAISASGWTLPSVASILTGTWPSIHRAKGKRAQLTPISPDVVMGSELLQQAGYRTLAVANAAFLSPVLGLDRGFDEFHHRHAYNRKIRRADESVRDALALLDTADDQPAFLLLHLFDPHLDYDPPAEFAFRFSGARRMPPPPLTMRACLDLCGEGAQIDAQAVEYVRSLYQAEVAFVDQQVGIFLEELKRRGRYESALVVLTSDHGEEFFEHRGFEHGHTLYEELVRVPLLIKWPANRRPVRAVVEEAVPTLDLMPTIFEIAGLEPPESFVGQSLTTLAERASDDQRLVFSEATLYGPERMSLRRGTHKAIVTYVRKGLPNIEIYELGADPDEQTNLAPSSPELVQSLGNELGMLRERLKRDGAAHRVGTVQDLDPSKWAEVMKSLDSLGYTRGSNETEERERGN